MIFWIPLFIIIVVVPTLLRWIIKKITHKELALVLLEEYNINSENRVVFGDEENTISFEVTEDSLVIATYDGNGKWFVKTKTKLSGEVEYKIKRIHSFIKKIVEAKNTK